MSVTKSHGQSIPELNQTRTVSIREQHFQKTSSVKSAASAERPRAGKHVSVGCEKTIYSDSGGLFNPAIEKIRAVQASTHASLDKLNWQDSKSRKKKRVLNHRGMAIKQTPHDL